MVGLKIFKGLFDDKIVRILNIFVKHPEKQYYLSEIARLSEVNATSTFRILNKLVAQEFIKVALIGRVRMYQLAKGEKANALSSLIRQEDNNPIDYFVSRVQEFEVEKIVADSLEGSSAKLIIVGEFNSKEVENVCDEIRNKYNFNIEFVQISMTQFESMKKFKTFKDKKILWEGI